MKKLAALRLESSGPWDPLNLIFQFMIGLWCKTGHAGSSQHYDGKHPEENNTNKRGKKSGVKPGIQDFLKQMHFSLRQSNIMLTGEQ